jgi:pimeloyl-ACP methyl ester carboxylesterase
MVDTILLRTDSPAGLRLGLREKRPSVSDPRRPPVLLAHGATLGGGLFDLPRAGYSLMEALARTGRAVYALDVRGYGTSLAALPDGPPEGQPPFARAADVVPDIAAAVAFILERCGAPEVDLVGFSWGTITASLYTGAHPERVRRLVLYAPLFAEINRLWLGRIADPQDPTRLAPGLGAWRLVTGSGLIERWNDDLPAGDPLRFREAGLAEQVFATMAALDPGSAARSPQSFRCPNGALADMVEVFNGHPLIDPHRLTMPLLIVRGEHDTTSSDTDCSSLLARVASADARYCVIRGASHFLCIERRRDDLYDALDRFLEPA